MTIYTGYMDISVTAFKQRCLEIIRTVERTGSRVSITRRGRVVAQLRRPPEVESTDRAPWEAMRALGGRLEGPPDQSVASDEDFSALK
jgi:antitoxin (DNA-binding transcriptional repressor) of toxin-antitoxin stability system